MAHWHQWFYDSCLESAATKNTTMINYDNWYDNGNIDGNDDNNAASGSRYDGGIFDTITTPHSCRQW